MSSFTAELREWIGLAEHLTERMAAGFLPHHVPLHVDAVHSGHFPGAEVPLHHRAGPQPLHRDCGKTHLVLGVLSQCTDVHKVHYSLFKFSSVENLWFGSLSSPGDWLTMLAAWLDGWHCCLATPPIWSGFKCWILCKHSWSQQDEMYYLGNVMRCHHQDRLLDCLELRTQSVRFAVRLLLCWGWDWEPRCA